MFNRKILIIAALVLGVGTDLCSAQIARNKVAPLSPSERRLVRCELHGTRLQADTVPTSYGIASGQNASRYQASRKLFSHARTHVSGGGVITSDSPGLQAVNFCAQCRAAEKRWLVTHKNSR